MTHDGSVKVPVGWVRVAVGKMKVAVGPGSEPVIHRGFNGRGRSSERGVTGTGRLDLKKSSNGKPAPVDARAK